MLKKTFAVTIALVLLLVLVVSLVAATSVGLAYVFDDFDGLRIKPPGDADDDPYWWVIANGDLGQYYAPCSDAACVTAEVEDAVTLARLRLFPDATPGGYTGVEMSELQTGFGYGQPARWLPTVDRPVVAVARVRFSANYHPDGSGGAVGSAGFWLWNSYLDFVNQTAHPIASLGFSWAEQGAGGGLDGLAVGVLQESFPVYFQPVTYTVDITDWMLWRMEWRVDAGGTQSVAYWIDDVLVGQATLAAPLPALSITFWNDNQYPTFTGGGEYVVEYHNPPEDQDFEIDFVHVYQTPLADVGDYAVLGLNSVWLRQGVELHSGHVGAQAASPGPTLNDGAEVSVGPHAVFHDPFSVLAGNRIKLKAQVAAFDLFYNELSAAGSAVYGQPFTPLSLPLVTNLPAWPEINPGATDYALGQGAHLALPAGAYGEIALHDSAVLTLTGGIYHLADLSLADGAQVVATAPTEVRIAGRLASGAEAVIGLAPGSGLNGSDLVLFVAGINGADGKLGSAPEAAVLGENNVVSATMYAPNGTLRLRRGTQARGAFIGRDVQVDKDVQLWLESAFAE